MSFLTLRWLALLMMRLSQLRFPLPLTHLAGTAPSQPTVSALESCCLTEILCPADELLDCVKHCTSPSLAALLVKAVLCWFLHTPTFV